MDKMMQLNVVVERESAVEELGKLLGRNGGETGLVLTSHKHSESTTHPGHLDAEFTLFVEGATTTRQMHLVFAMAAMVDGIVTGIMFGDEDVVRNTRRQALNDRLKALGLEGGLDDLEERVATAEALDDTEDVAATRPGHLILVADGGKRIDLGLSDDPDEDFESLPEE